MQHILYILLTNKFIYMLVSKQNTAKKTCAKFRQVCPQNTDKIVSVENTASRKSASVRPA